MKKKTVHYEVQWKNGKDWQWSSVNWYLEKPVSKHKAVGQVKRLIGNSDAIVYRAVKITTEVL